MKSQKKYQRIVEDLKQRIEKGSLHVGDRLESEAELCEIYQVSRMTVNKALGILALDGYIRRIAGKGSYICEQKVNKKVGSNRSFSHDMLQIGMKPGSRLVEYRVFRARDLPVLQEKMKLNDDDFIYYMVRLRTGDHLPIAISYTYLSSEHIPAFDIERLSSSLYDYLEELGLKLSFGEGTMTAVMPSQEQKEIMQIDDTAMLKNTHYTYLNDQKVIEYTETFYIGSRYLYTYQFTV